MFGPCPGKFPKVARRTLSRLKKSGGVQKGPKECQTGRQAVSKVLINQGYSYEIINPPIQGRQWIAGKGGKIVRGYFWNESVADGERKKQMLKNQKLSWRKLRPSA